MCIELEKEPKKKYVASNLDTETLVYYKKIDKDDPNHFVVKGDEIAHVICPDGQEIPVTDPGTYKIIIKPIDVIWLKKTPTDIKIGIPKEATEIGIGFHAIIRLHPTNPSLIIQSVKRKNLSISEVKDVLRNIARETFQTLINNMHENIEEYRKKFNIKLNEFLATTNLAGFTAVTSYIGFSYMCKPTELLEAEPS